MPNPSKYALNGAAVLLGSLLAASLTGGAGSAKASDYSATDLLKPCVEADNDARWGETAELECEQFILGFVDALAVTGDKSVCPPAVNTPDEVRWAYMRWVHLDYSKHSKMSAAEGLMATLRAKFPCKK